MKKGVLIALLTCASLTISAQSDDDHLEPVAGYLSNDEHEYYSFIYKHLIEDLYNRPIAWMLTMPGRAPENVVSIEHTKESFKVSYKICKESIWFSEEKEKNEVITYEQDIDTATVVLIETVFRKVLLEARYRNDFHMPFSGPVYIFSSGIMSGQASTPGDGTKMGELAGIGQVMIALAKSSTKEDQIKFNKELRIRAEKFLKKRWRVRDKVKR